MAFKRKKKTSLADMLSGVKGSKKTKAPSVVAREETPAGVADSFKRDFCNWLETGYRRIFEKRSPGRHASQLWKTCGRRTVLEALCGIENEPEQISAGSFMTQDEGHALHDWWQNEYLAGWGKIKGEWRCARCGKLHGSSKEPIERPERCYNTSVCREQKPRFASRDQG